MAWRFLRPLVRSTNRQPPLTGMLPNFLVDVDHQARVSVLLAAEHFLGADVDVREPVEPTANQHRVRGRGRHRQSGSDLLGRRALTPPQGHDLAFDRLGGAVRTAMRTTQAVVPAVRAHLGIASGPAFGGRLRNVEVLGGLEMGQLSSMMRRASISRPFGISGALA